MDSPTARAFVSIFCLLAFAATDASALSSKKSCIDAKEKAGGKHAACLAKALAKAVKKDTATDFSRCDTKLEGDVAKADERYGAACPASEDAGIIIARNLAFADDLEAALASPRPSTKAAIGCATSKIKSTSKHALCGVKAARRELRSGPFTRDVSRCDEKLTSDFAKAETKAAGSCPTSEDATAMRDLAED
jgi:hypothetical protein